MSQSTTNNTSSNFPDNRRTFLRRSSVATLSATAVALLYGKETLASDMDKKSHHHSPEQDSAILNVALGLEHEAINAYQLGAQSGLLQKPVLDVAVLFQSQHKQHRDALISTIEKMGGEAVAQNTLEHYAESLQANTLKSQADVLQLATRLEAGATNAYLGVIPSFSDATLAQIAGRLAADETMHWTVLTQALGAELPQEALSFGG